MQQAIDDIRVHPVVLLGAGLKMGRDVLVVFLEFGVHSGAKPASPGSSFSHVLDHAIGVRTRFAPVCGFVMLVERVRTPEALVTIGAWVFPPPLVKLLLVPLPIELALERLVTRSTPVFGLRGCRVRCCWLGERAANGGCRTEGGSCGGRGQDALPPRAVGRYGGYRGAHLVRRNEMVIRYGIARRQLCYKVCLATSPPRHGAPRHRYEWRCVNLGVSYIRLLRGSSSPARAAVAVGAVDTEVAVGVVGVRIIVAVVLIDRPRPATRSRLLEKDQPASEPRDVAWPAPGCATDHWGRPFPAHVLPSMRGVATASATLLLV